MAEKKKRAKCETSSRHTIILNYLNPRERIIFDFLTAQFNKSDSIKDILYDYIVTNDLQVDIKPVISKGVVNSNKVISNLSHDDKQVISNDIASGNSVINEYVQADNKKQSKYTSNDNDFTIDLNNIDDEEVNISTGKNNKSATENAMDFLLEM